MSDYKKLGKNIALLTIGSFSSKFLSFFFLPLYTAVLSTAEYGIVDLIKTTISLIMPVFTLIISESILRFSLDASKNKGEVFTVGMIINALGFLVLLIFSPVILLFPVLKPYYLFFIIYYLSYSFNLSLSYFARGIDKVKVVTVSGIISTAITILLNLFFLLFLKWGLNGYLLAMIISNAGSGIFLFAAARMYKYLDFRKRLNYALVREMLHYSIPMIPNSISWWISNSLDRYLVTIYVGIAANGIYSVAYKIPTILSFVSGIFIDAWRLSAVDSFESSEPSALYSNIYEKYLSFSLLCSAALIALNKLLAQILYSKDFYQAWVFVPVLIVAVMYHGFGEFFGTIYTSAKKTSMLFYSSLAGAVINTILNFCLIPPFGTMGASIATLVSYMAIWLIRLVHSRKILCLSIQSKNAVLCLALIILQAIAASIDTRFTAILSPLIGAVIIFLNRNFIKEMLPNIIRLLKSTGISR